MSARLKLLIALIIMAAFWRPQAKILVTRVEQEMKLWRTGQQLFDLAPQGTIMLEPAGMIPYENRQLKVIDDVGLLDPWIAKRRAGSDGWRTDAIAHYKPEWMIIRMREYVMPELWSAGTHRPYRDSTESKLEGYGVVLAPDLERVNAKWGRAKMVSSNLVVLRAK